MAAACVGPVQRPRFLHLAAARNQHFARIVDNEHGQRAVELRFSKMAPLLCIVTDFVIEAVDENEFAHIRLFITFSHDTKRE